MGTVNVVTDFSADPTGAADSSSAFSAAAASGGRIYAPAGTYKVNISVAGAFDLFGDGPTRTILVPNSNAAPIITLGDDLFWTYARTIDGVGFEGSEKQGVGVALGTGDPADYDTNDEFANSATFRNCRFTGLDKGLVAGAGNLGLELYSCNAKANKYGLYFSDKKDADGGRMHAGCKYFFGGEISDNDVGIYIHNVTDGFGGISLHGTILEGNGINVYCYTEVTRQPITFIDCWNEVSGILAGKGSNISLDEWTGSTRSTISVPAHAYVFDGANSSYLFLGGFVSDIRLKAENSRVTTVGSNVETDSNFGGNPSIVDSGDSFIVHRNPHSSGGTRMAERIVVEGSQFDQSSVMDQFTHGRRAFATTPRFAKQSGYGGTGVFEPYTSAKSATGGPGSPPSPVAGIAVSDGLIYPACNEFALPFTAGNQFYLAGAPSLTLQTGWWYVATFDVKRVSGSGTFFVGDLNDDNMASATPGGTEWQTFAAIAEARSNDSISLWVGNSASTFTFRISAFQLRGFPTRHQAAAFLADSVYVGA